MTKKEYAIELHDRGCNCAQSVVCSFAKECGIDETTLMKLSEAFGRGAGGMQGMCGALSGALMIAGIKYADGNIEAPKSKATTYSIAAKACEEFKNKCGSLICSELKGIESGKPLFPCPECIKVGTMIAENILGEKYDNN
ncbi:MAG: C_GCAxxG_C_C family protein [Clostridia bacterium]|nr:C_GCAxxG_C_C family protein [Clostridia bacterium]